MKTAEHTKVIIAGGGTAGWSVAAALCQQLGKLLDITLIESKSIGTVSVGEATIPTIKSFHKLIGLDEVDFIKATQATIKLGIAFENWGAVGDRYIHSFGQVGKSTWMADFQHIWAEARSRGLADPIEDYCFELQAAEAGRFSNSSSAGISYAYHLDSGAYADVLRQLCEKNGGVKRIEAIIEDVHLASQTGDIESLSLDNGERITGDVFIDCTGFRALLIGQALGAEFEDWSNWLFADRALAVQTERTDTPLPYTRSIAYDAGWRWRIPLQHRTGNGLVYSSRYMSDEKAHDILRAEIDGEVIKAPNPIRFQTGLRRMAWSGNCIGIGLSSGFVEPLESTSIHMIHVTITRLIQLFPFGPDNAAKRKVFNELFALEMEQIRDFIILHYHVTARRDSAFWKQCADMDIPDSLRLRLELFKENFYTFQNANELFRTDSWLQCLLGQGLSPSGHHQIAKSLSDKNLSAALADLKTNISKAVNAMPPHHSFINSYAPAPKNISENMKG